MANHQTWTQANANRKSLTIAKYLPKHASLRRWVAVMLQIAGWLGGWIIHCFSFIRGTVRADRTTGRQADSSRPGILTLDAVVIAPRLGPSVPGRDDNVDKVI